LLEDLDALAGTIAMKVWSSLGLEFFFQVRDVESLLFLLAI